MLRKYSGPCPISIETLRANLRLPEAMDDILLTTFLYAGIEYVERHTGATIWDQEVTQDFLSVDNAIRLKYYPDDCLIVSIGERELEEEVDYRIVKSNPAYILPSEDIISEARENRNGIKVSYISKGKTDQQFINAVIMIASAYYNSPEGLAAADLSRFDNYLNTLRY